MKNICILLPESAYPGGFTPEDELEWTINPEILPDDAFVVKDGRLQHARTLYGQVKDKMLEQLKGGMKRA